MSIKRYILIFALLLSLGRASVSAQLNENVAVEGRFEPVVIETERINIYPSGVRFEMPAANLREETRGVVTPFRPSLLTMGFSGWETSFRPTGRKGYIDFNLGSWLNSGLSAGYRPLCDSVNVVDLALRFNSTSLYKVNGLPKELISMSKRYLYDGTLSASWNRRLPAGRLLNAGVAYRLARFDYYGSALWHDSPFIGTPAPAQTVNDLKVNLGLDDSPALPGGWHAALGAGYFGYNALYGENFLNNAHISGQRETEISLEGGYRIPVGGNNTVIIDGDAKLLLYAGNDWLKQRFPDVGNYGNITLKPAFQYGRNDFNLRLGAVVDVTVNATGDTPGTKYSLLHFAPDIKMNVKRDRMGFRIGLTGGSRLMTLAGKEQLDYYQAPYLTSTQPMYTPLDAEAGLSIGPFAGFTADVSGGYNITLHTPVGGWYQTLLGGYSESLEEAAVIGSPIFDTLNRGVNLHGAKLKASLNYAYSTIFSASGSLSYTPQNGKTGYFNGYDRPKWIVDASIAVRPVRKLKIDLGYTLKGERTIYNYYIQPSADGSEVALIGIRLPNFSDLRAGVTYSFSDRLHVYCRAANLLNRHVEILPALQSQGVTVCGGFDLIF